MSTHPDFFGKAIWTLLKTLGVDLPYEPAILLLGIYTPRSKSTMKKSHLDSCVPCHATHNSQTLKATHAAENRGLARETVTKHTVEYYSVIKKVKPCNLLQNDGSGW